MKKSNLLFALLFVFGLSIINFSAIGQNYKVVETGQMECYDHDGNQITCPSEGEAYYGQDAQYTGHSISLIDNGDGTVTDENTGLMWQQVPSSQTHKWQEAIDYCDVLEFAGHDDWRMPTLKELFAIGNFSSGWPYLDQTYFHLASGQVTKDEQYWGNNHYVGVTVEGGSDAAFGVNHVTGHIKAYPANSGGPVGGKYVRAVRGNAYGENDYVDNGDGTISDNATGLMWMQDDNGEGIDWEAALTYAEGNEFANHSDWRLPNVKELHSIVDYNYSPSATEEENQGPAIDPMFNCTPIINEGGNDDYAYYWTGTSALFSTNQPYYYAWYVAFGMAVNGEGDDFHGAGGVRFDTKYEGGPLGEGGERYYNYVRLVRDISATGLGENGSNQINLKLYPNPVRDILIVETSPGISQLNTIKIYNTAGQIVYEGKLVSNTLSQIDVSNFSKGVYICKLSGTNAVSVEKFLKE